MYSPFQVQNGNPLNDPVTSHLPVQDQLRKILAGLSETRTQSAQLDSLMNKLVTSPAHCLANIWMQLSQMDILYTKCYRSKSPRNQDSVTNRGILVKGMVRSVESLGYPPFMERPHNVYLKEPFWVLTAVLFLCDHFSVCINVTL